MERWPKEGTHTVDKIEPKSWSAINDAASIPSTLQAVRICVYVDFSKEEIYYTWHKTFNISIQQNST